MRVSSSRNPAEIRAVLLTVVFGLTTLGAGAQCPGVPTFLPPVNVPPVGAVVIAIQSADLDGDGDLDLVLCNTSQIGVARNAGGTFVPEPPMPAPPQIVDLAVGDFNDDGVPDIAAIGTLIGAGTLQGRVTVFLATGSSPVITFAEPVVYTLGPQAQSGSAGRAIRVGDMNADGILDIVAVDENSSNVWILLGQGAIGIGNGTFGTAVPYPVGATGLKDAAIADFNGDGAKDLALVSFGGGSSSTNATLLAGVVGPGGTPTGTLVPAGTVAIPGVSAVNIEAVDVNADGFLDLVVATAQAIVVAHGVGGFAFVSTSYPAGTYPQQLAVGDFSGDGVLDFAVVRNQLVAGPNFSILVGNGAGGYTSYNNTFSVGNASPSSITSGDFNGDGLLDVALGKSLDGVFLLFGTCAPATPKTVTVASPNGGENLAAGSFASIAWTKSASVAAVDIDVSHDHGATWASIGRDLTGTSSSWYVTPTGSHQSLVRVNASGFPAISDVSNATFNILAPGAAASVIVGSSCGPMGAAPALAIGLPVIGTTVAVTVMGAGGAHPGALFASTVPAAPTFVPPGCVIELDLNMLVQVAAFTTAPSGSWVALAEVPNTLELAGFTVRAQAATVLPVAPGYAITNAVQLTIGF